MCQKCVDNIPLIECNSCGWYGDNEDTIWLPENEDEVDGWQYRACPNCSARIEEVKK